MTPELTRDTALVAVGLVLLVSPALFPVQPQLYHYPDAETTENRTALERQGYEVIAYENLSERGKELYRRSLREGKFGVPLGSGAPEFRYPTSAELGDIEDYQQRRRQLWVVIERPADADLPPPAESVEMAEEIRERARREREDRREERREGESRAAETPTRTAGNASTRTATATRTLPSVERQREVIGRYDVLATRTELPPVAAPPSLARLLAAMLGIVLVGLGGYRSARP